jgi:hypothetical protein
VLANRVDFICNTRYTLPEASLGPTLILYYLLQILPFFPVVAIGAWLIWRIRARKPWDITLIIVSAAALVLTALVLTNSMLRTRFDVGWAAPRLAPILSWVYGGKLYYRPGEGPVLVRLYGPVSSLVYLPVALARRPTQALYIGTAINFVMMVGPLFWLLIRCSRIDRRPLPRSILFIAIAAFGLLCGLGSLLYEYLTMVTIDGPAIGFGACACAILINAAAEPEESKRLSMRAAILCGLFASLCGWDKQTLWPIVAALLIYAIFSGGVRRGGRFSAIVLLTICLVSSLLLLAFDADAMWFNMLVIPSRHSWTWHVSTPVALLRGARWIWRNSNGIGWTLLAGLLIWFVSLRGSGTCKDPTQPEPDAGSRLQHYPWLLPLLASLFILPTTAAAYAKVGGGANNSAAAACFALVAALGIFVRMIAQTHVDSLPLRGRLARAGLLGVMIGLIAAPSSQKTIAALPREIREAVRPTPIPNEIVFDYCRAHPGEVYFPYYPLATLLAEHRTYHHDGGVWDLLRAGFPMSQQQLHAYLPPHMRAMALDRSPATSSMPPLLKEYNQVVKPGDLPDPWIFLVRPSEPANQ